jgi:uncharacterized protein YjbI with pentapeptide repeats
MEEDIQGIITKDTEVLTTNEFLNLLFNDFSIRSFKGVVVREGGMPDGGFGRLYGKSFDSPEFHEFMREQGANFRERDLSYEILNGIVLYGADLSRANLSWSSLQGADIRNSNFRGANLYHTNFNGARLFNANLSKTYLYFTEFKGADLRNSNFRGANLSGVNFYQSFMRGSKVELAESVEVAIFNEAVGLTEKQKKWIRENLHYF